MIPKNDMSRIYADMFLADKQLHFDHQLRRIADTSRVYEAIFAKYGYTIEDYNASQEKYILDARRYVKILKKSAELIEKENKVFKEEKARLDAILLAKEGMTRFAPNRIYLLDTIACADSLLIFDFQEGLDTIFRGPRLVVAADTVVVRTDSVKTDIGKKDMEKKDMEKKRPAPGNRLKNKPFVKVR